MKTHHLELEHQDLPLQLHQSQLHLTTAQGIRVEATVLPLSPLSLVEPLLNQGIIHIY